MIIQNENKIISTFGNTIVIQTKDGIKTIINK